jgi:hypothetical protein
MEKKPQKQKEFVEREWNDSTKGDYDENGFFVTPNGSFWDPDGVYFNKEGFDKHGGYYDDNNEYVPGEGWDEANNCYLDELNDYYDDDYEYGSDHDDEEDDGFGDIDINNIQDEEELLMKNMEGVEKEKYDPNNYESNFENEYDKSQQNKDENKEEKEEDKKEEKKEEEKFEDLEKNFFEENKNDIYLKTYLDESILLENNVKEKIRSLFEKYIIPFSPEVQEVICSKFLKKVSGDVVEGEVHRA